MQHARPVGPTTVNTAATFSAEMVQGSHPDQGRFHISPRFAHQRAGLVSAQTTHVEATFQSNMSAGWHPDRPAVPPSPMSALTQRGHVVSVPTPVLTFSAEMTRGLGAWAVRPLLPFHELQDWQVTPPDVPAFGPEMVQGSRPDKNRAWLPLRTGSYATTIPEPLFSPEMADGWTPDRPRPPFMAQLGASLAQPTHVQAGFSVEMGQGQHADRSRPIFTAPAGWSISQPTFIVQMTPEMFAGSLPDRPRILLGAKIPLPASQTTPVAAPFTPDMVLGSHPDQPRPYIAPKWGFSVSQVSPTNAPLSPEMTTGWWPLTSRGFAVHPSPVAIPPDVTLFSIEMVLGSRPDRPRIYLAPRIPLPLSQTTPIAAPFTVDMIVGSHPDLPRGFSFRHAMTGPWVYLEAIFGIGAAQRFIFISADASQILVLSDPSTIVIRPDPEAEPEA
jgi:hypothetical protein